MTTCNVKNEKLEQNSELQIKLQFFEDESVCDPPLQNKSRNLWKVEFDKLEAL